MKIQNSMKHSKPMEEMISESMEVQTNVGAPSDSGTGPRWLPLLKHTPQTARSGGEESTEYNNVILTYSLEIRKIFSGNSLVGNNSLNFF